VGRMFGRQTVVRIYGSLCEFPSNVSMRFHNIMFTEWCRDG
jgi:hypothetical protein